MNLKHVKNIQGNTASMFLFSDIGGYGVDGQNFVNELQWLRENGVNNVTIHINSGGGSVLDGLSILRSIQLFDGIITTQVEGIAASIAGVIALGGQRRKMVDFGRIMIHDPSFSGGDTVDEKQKNAITEIRTMLISIFERNSTISKDEIDNLMSAESWLDANSAFKMGLVDEIIDTQRKAENVFEGVTDIAAMVSRATNIHLQIANPKIENMNEIKNHLKLSADANEQTIVETVVKIEDRATTAETKVTELTNTLTEKETEIETSKTAIETKDAEIVNLTKTIAENVVDKAITAGKFAKEKRAELIDQALEMGVDKFSTLTNAISAKPAKIVDLLNTDTPDATDGKTFRQLEKENPKALNALRNSDSEKYKVLYKAEYGVELAD